MYILGIESTCDETAAAVVQEGLGAAALVPAASFAAADVGVPVKTCALVQGAAVATVSGAPVAGVAESADESADEAGASALDADSQTGCSTP